MDRKYWLAGLAVAVLAGFLVMTRGGCAEDQEAAAEVIGDRVIQTQTREAGEQIRREAEATRQLQDMRLEQLEGLER